MFKIKLYADGAEKKTLLEMNEDPKIQGMTTNPSLMKKAGVQDYRGFAKEVLSVIKTKPISFEVFADDLKEMKRQALEIREWGKNVYVKIPITNSEGVSTIPLIRELSQSGVKLNVTALFTFEQIYETCEAVQSGAPSIVSVFAGRIADTGVDPMPLMHAASAICKKAGKDVELLWASTREVLNIVQAESAGCSIITVPPEILKKLHFVGMDLKAMSLDTVKTFKKDSDSAGFQL
jgi:transaldolase